ncbi:MAG TPA: zincin-like metallopeptidase domain-containing protein [Elusimicrobiales bacterium]|nr:zincin-like metallopeptidase domain-containing protein [Elusimicrobiales bacterium]
MKNTDVIAKITDKIIEKMESGKLNWNKPWTAGAMPQNFISKKAYRGWNLFATMFNEFESPYYLTFNQIKKLGGSVKKGSKGTPIVFWNKLNKVTKDANDEEVTKGFLLAKDYVVFNAEQIEGIDFGTIEKNELGTCEELEQAISEMEIPVKIKHGLSDRAFYTPTFDYIQMPEKAQFKSEGEYYSTLVHEVIHSTGHNARLNRLSLNDAKFDNKKHSYSYEELVAELGASYLTAMYGISTEQTEKNSAAYLQGWLKTFKADKQMLYKASADAQKAVDYIVKKAQSEEVSEDKMEMAAA